MVKALDRIAAAGSKDAVFPAVFILPGIPVKRIPQGFIAHMVLRVRIDDLGAAPVPVGSSNDMLHLFVA